MSYPKTMDDTQDEIGEWAQSKGWWDADKLDSAPKIDGRNSLEICALIGSEVSEAVEEARLGRMATEFVADKNGIMKPEGFYSELADVVIRIMDTCAQAGVSLYDEIQIKMEYNHLREHRHGGKLA